MQRHLFFLIPLIVGCFSSMAQPTVMTPQKFVPGKIILKVAPEFRSQCGPDEINLPGLQSLFRELGSTKTKKAFPKHEAPTEAFNALGQAMIDLSLIYEIEIDAQLNPVAVAADIAATPGIAYAEPLYIHEITYNVNDTYTHVQWYLDTIRAREAWDIEKGDTNVVVGIIDTGTSFLHNDLKDQIKCNLNDPIDGIDNDNDGYVDNYRGWDFAHQDNDPTFVGNGPGYDHGVIVSGPSSADPDNNFGLAGIGFDCKMVPLKVASDNSLGIAYGYQAIVYAADRGIKIMNLSWGSPSYSNYGRDITDYAAINKQCLLIAACGNYHRDILYYPASYPNVISVAASSQTDACWAPASTSTIGTSYNYKVDIMAPGHGIPTIASASGYYWGASGTSVAAPMVAGAAALVQSHFPQLTAYQCGQLIRVAAQDVYDRQPSSDYDEKLGKGRLDVKNALTLTSPSVRVIDFEIQTPDDHYPKSWDTVDVKITLANFLAPTQGLTVEISTTDEFTKGLQNPFQIGTLGTMDTITVVVPQQFAVIQSLLQKQSTWMRFGFEDLSGYTDFQYEKINLYPAAMKLETSLLSLGFSDHGTMGVVHPIWPAFGYGLNFDQNSNVLSEGGLLLGTHSSQISDFLGHSRYNGDMDWTNAEAPVYSQGEHNSRHLTYSYSDQGSDAALSVQVRQQNTVLDGPENEGFILQEFTLENIGTDSLSDLKAGLWADWMIESQATAIPHIDSSLRTVYFHSPQTGDSSFYGLAFLGTEMPVVDVAPTLNYPLGDSGKWRGLTGMNGFQDLGPQLYSSVVSTPAFNLLPGEERIIAFALLAGESEEQLKSAAQQAFYAYHCLVRNHIPEDAIAATHYFCPGSTVDLVANGYQQYNWSDGSQDSTLTVHQEGTYQVTVTNSIGCQTTLSTDASHFIEPRVDAGQDREICMGDSTLLEANHAVVYSWQGANLLNTPHLWITPTQDQTYVVEGISLNGCISQDTIAVTMLPMPSPTFNHTIYSTAVMFQVTSQDAVTWEWDFGNGIISTDNNPINDFQTPGTYPVCLTVWNSAGCSQTACEDIIILPTDMEEVINEIDLVVSPNPGQDWFRFETSQPLQDTASITIIDELGRKVIGLPTAFQQSSLLLNLEHLASGIYFVQIKTSTKILTKKFIKN